MLTGQHWIAGEWSGEASGGPRGIDPKTGEFLDPPFSEAIADEIDRAVLAARRAAIDWRQLSHLKRADLLEAVASEIESLGDALIERADLETALGTARLEGERGRTTFQLRFFADLLRAGWWLEPRIDTADADRKPLPKPDLRRSAVPLGPVAVFGASNFPLAFSVAGGDTASAWAAGCPVIVKAHPAHPGTSELVAQAIGRAVDSTDTPPGVFSLLHGAGVELGRGLVSHPGVTAVAFTGSTAGGTALAKVAAERDTPIPVFAEMGSVNPVVVLPGAMAESGGDIAAGLASSVTLGAGQFCTNPGLVLVPASAAERFASDLSRHLADAAPLTAVTAEIGDGYRKSVRRAAEVCGVSEPEDTGNENGAGVSPAVLQCDAATFLINSDLREEIFGPATLLVTWNSALELRDLIASLPGSLTATVHGCDRDFEDYPGILERLSRIAGRVIVGGFPTGVEVAHAMHHGGPFPATTDSRATSVGSAAIRRFLRPVTYQNTPDRLLPAELQNANPLGLRRLVDGVWTESALD